MAYKKYVTFSYDDGVKQDARFAEILNRYGLRCTFNLNSGLMPQAFTEGHRHLSLNEAETVYAGHEIATHSLTHPHLENLTYDEICSQIREDSEKLAELVGAPVLGHAYPYGTYNDTVVKALADCGIRYARTVKATLAFGVPGEPLLLHPTCHHSHPGIFRLIDDFIAAEPGDSDLLLYIWGHTYEFDRNTEGNSWEHIEEVCRRIAGRDDMEYVTNMQFFDRTIS